MHHMGWFYLSMAFFNITDRMYYQGKQNLNIIHTTNLLWLYIVIYWTKHCYKQIWPTLWDYHDTLFTIIVCGISTVDDHQRWRGDFLICFNQLVSREKITTMHSNMYCLRQIAAVKSQSHLEQSEVTCN